MTRPLLKLRRFFDLLTTKENEAIKYIQKYEPEEGYFVADSGGKDSCVVLDLVKRSGVKFKAYYSCTTIDPPEILKFLKKFHPETVFLFPKMNYWQWLRKKAFLPTKFRRWCCDYLKEQVGDQIPMFYKITGIRQEESFNRKKRGRTRVFKKRHVFSPIFYFSELDVWEYIEKYKLPYCSLHDEEFSRVGCVVCPFITGENKHGEYNIRLQTSMKKWPHFYKKFEQVAKEVYEFRRSQGKLQDYISFEEYIDYWYKGKSKIKIGEKP